MLGTILLIGLGVIAVLVAIIIACVIHWSVSSGRPGDLYDQDD